MRHKMYRAFSSAQTFLEGNSTFLPEISTINLRIIPSVTKVLGLAPQDGPVTCVVRGATIQFVTLYDIATP